MHILPVTVRYTFYTDKQYYSAERNGHMKAKKVNEAKAVSESGEIVKFDEAGMPQLDVWLEDETIWLTQKQMGFLFGCAPQNITYHLREIYKIGELEADSTCKDFLQVQIEGGRRISRMQKFYNLDAVISVGYRVNSIRGVRFRQWATKEVVALFNFFRRKERKVRKGVGAGLVCLADLTLLILIDPKLTLTDSN